MDCFYCGKPGARVRGRKQSIVMERRRLQGRKPLRHAFHAFCLVEWEWLVMDGYERFAKGSRTFPQTWIWRTEES